MDLICILGSLQALGQNVDDDNFVTIILSKLPRSVVVMLEMSKDVSQTWSVKLVREKLADYLTRIERADKVASNDDKGSAMQYPFTADSLFAGESHVARHRPQYKKTEMSTRAEHGQYREGSSTTRHQWGQGKDFKDNNRIFGNTEQGNWRVTERNGGQRIPFANSAMASIGQMSVPGTGRQMKDTGNLVTSVQDA